MNSIVRNFLKSKASSLYSEDYNVEFEFMDDGSVKLKGYFWLKAFEDMNVSFSTYPVMNIDPDLKDKCWLTVLLLVDFIFFYTDQCKLPLPTSPS